MKPHFAGTWFTTFGPLQLEQRGAELQAQVNDPGFGEKLAE